MKSSLGILRCSLSSQQKPRVLLALIGSILCLGRMVHLSTMAIPESSLHVVKVVGVGYAVAFVFLWHYIFEKCMAKKEYGNQKAIDTTTKSTTEKIQDTSSQTKGNNVQFGDFFGNNSKPTSNNFTESTIEEDPLTFFRNFLSQDKQRQRSQKTCKKKNMNKGKQKPSNPPRQSTRNNTAPKNSSGTPSDIQEKSFFKCEVNGNLSKIKSIKAAECPLTPIRPSNKKQDPLPSVSFADEDGKDMETFFEIDPCDIANPVKRVLILLLLPAQQVFEYIAVEYRTDLANDDNNKENDPNACIIYISQILQKLSTLSCDARIAQESFVSLVRVKQKTTTNGDMRLSAQDLFNSSSIQSYKLRNDEILVAIPQGFTKEQILEHAKIIFQQRRLIRVLKRNKWWGVSMFSEEVDQVAIPAL